MPPTAQRGKRLRRRSNDHNEQVAKSQGAAGHRANAFVAGIFMVKKVKSRGGESWRRATGDIGTVNDSIVPLEHLKKLCGHVASSSGRAAARPYQINRQVLR